MNKSRRSALRHHVAKNFASLLPFVCLIQLALSANVFAQSELIAGQNINMVSGKQWPGGDPFLNKQNEGTIGVSARNDCHLMGGSNDYRSVDLPGLPDGKTVGDSWVSTYVSTDCAGSWFSTLMPGYPQDDSPLGLASPLKLALGGQGYEASADPVVRSGASGLFHYSGIAFTRAFEPPSAGFVSTYIDLNNTELGNPFGFVGTVLFDQNDDGISFIDKPWTAVDKPRGGVTQFIDVHTDDNGIPDLTNVAVECGNVYTAYARIEGDGSAAIRSQIMFTRSEDCAQTFSEPIRVSLPNTINQGATVAINPLDGRIQVAWRQFENATLNCTRKANFWRTTPAAWPVEQLELAGMILRKGDGGHVVAELADADDDFDTESFNEFDYSDDADRPSGVLRQLLAVWLNSLAGADVSAVADELAEAEAWLVENPLGTHPKGDIKRRGNDLRKILRDYNKGKLGPGNCANMMGSATNGLLSGLNPNAIMVVSSTDFGETFSEPVAATGPNYHPFEQGTTEFSFRTLGFPTMVFDHQGRSYIAVSSRGFASADPDPVGGDARIAVTTSMNGTTWTPLQAIDDEPGVPNHQIMPAFDFHREKLFLLYYDFRHDSLALFHRFIVDVPLDESTVLRHTTDVRAAIADPADSPVFTDYSILDGASTQASRYPFLILDNAGTTYRQQLKINSPGLPVAKDGSVPFFSDYVDLGSQDFYYDDATSSWEFDIFAGRGVPVVHAVWTDNRDVVPPLDNNWQSYVPPTYVVDGELPSEEPRESIFDPTQTVATCTPGTIDIDRTQMRNQNIYTSRLTQGLVASVPGNNRALGTIQRAFVGFVQNTTSETKLFRLTILNQPVGGSASFDQFAPEVERIEVVNSNSSIARTVFVTSTPSDPSASVDIRVQEIIELSEGGYMDGDLAAVMTINPDPTAPVSDDGGILAEEIYTPAIFNPAIFNPAIFNASLLGTDEVGIYNPAIFNPAIFNATDQVTASLVQLALLNPAIFNPAIFNPAIFNPAIFNPAIFNPAIFNPAIFNPAIFNPAIFNPAIFNPAIFNPAIFNPAIFNNSMVETSVVVTNTGNATAAYSLNLDLEDPPEGFLFQIMVYRTYLVPSADGCTLTEQVVQEQLVTDSLPNLNGDLSSPDSTSFYVDPGDYVVVSVRIVPDPDASIQGNPADINTLDTLNLSQSIVPQAVDTAGVAAGQTEPTPVIIYAPGAAPVGTLTEADWHTPGDGLITFDSATGMEWLDLTRTVNMSVADVSAQLVMGGQFEGFSFATANQVGELFTNAGLSGYATTFAFVLGNADPLQLTAATGLQDLWGITRRPFGNDISQGFIDEIAPGAPSSVRIQAVLGVEPTLRWSGGTRGSSGSSASDQVGSALIRPMIVSVRPIGTLSEADWQVPGDGQITFDSATGLDWLNLTVTANMSVTDVTAGLGPGGAFEGFRYATAAEVEQLFANAGLTGFGTEATGTIQGNTDPVLEATAAQLQALWGLTCVSGLPTCTYDTSAGYIGSPSGGGTFYYAVLNVSPPGWGAGTTGAWTVDGSARAYLGSMLVRP